MELELRKEELVIFNCVTAVFNVMGAPLDGTGTLLNRMLATPDDVGLQRSRFGSLTGVMLSFVGVRGVAGRLGRMPENSGVLGCSGGDSGARMNGVKS